MPDDFDPTTITDPTLRAVVQTLMNQVETLHEQNRTQAPGEHIHLRVICASVRWGRSASHLGCRRLMGFPVVRSAPRSMNARAGTVHCAMLLPRLHQPEPDLMLWHQHMLLYCKIHIPGRHSLAHGAGRMESLRSVRTLRFLQNKQQTSISGYVRHGDERWLLAQILTLNLDEQISVLVLPGGDAQVVQVLQGPSIVGPDSPSGCRCCRSYGM